MAVTILAGRPPKEGIDYSNWNVDMFDNDPDIDKLIDGQGWIGFSIYFFLCQRAYGANGYYFKWSYSDAATTARKMGGGIGSETVIQAVDLCCKIGLFDKGLLAGEGILTGRGIQKRYMEVAKNRRYKTVIKNYWLLTNSESEGLNFSTLKSDYKPTNANYKAANSNYEPANSNYEYRKKSKVKESKVKESKEEKSTIEEISIEGYRLRYDASQLKIIDEFFEVLKHTRRSASIASTVIGKIYKSWDKYAQSKVIYALHKYIHNPSLHDKKENYVLGIIKNTTSEEVEKYKKNLQLGSGNNGVNQQNINKDITTNKRFARIEKRYGGTE